MPTNNVNADIGSINSAINRSLNGLSTAGIYVLEKGGTVIAPAILGYMGGMLTGVGASVGLIQGITSGVYHSVIHVPVANYIEKNRGSAPNQINYNTAEFLKFIGVITTVAVPIFFTMYYGEPIANKLLSFTTEGSVFNWILKSTPTRSYTVITGGLVNIAPALAQHWISFWRTEAKHNKY